MKDLLEFQNRWKAYLCTQDLQFQIHYDYETEKVTFSERDYSNRQRLIDDALPMERMRHLLQRCLQNEARKRFVLIPIAYSGGAKGLLLIHHHATLPVPYAVRCDLDPHTAEQMQQLVNLDLVLSDFFSSFRYKYLRATYPAALNTKLNKWMQSDQAAFKPYGTETYRELYSSVTANIVTANTYALLLFQFSNLSASWHKCEKWLSSQTVLDTCEILFHALEDEEENWSYTLDDVTAQLASCQAQCEARNAIEDQSLEDKTLIASLQQQITESLQLIEQQKEEILEEQEASTFWRSKLGDRFHLNMKKHQRI